MFGPNDEFDSGPFDGPDEPEPVAVAPEPPTLHKALAHCRNVVRAAAAVEPNGMERGRLDALADALAAELRIQRQRGG